MSKESKSNLNRNVLFFGRKNCSESKKALNLLKKLQFNVTLILSESRGEQIPKEALEWTGDYILCFRSLFFLPESILKKASIAAINFHPAPPEYPGSGCINFALYDECKNFGVTAHLMNAKIDNGKILECRRFQISDSDNVDTLLKKTHSELISLFKGFVKNLNKGGVNFIIQKEKECENESWRGEAKLINELNELQTIKPNISEKELQRIIRATYTESFPPKMILHGYEFILKKS